MSERRQVIELLRSGVPSSEVSSLLSGGRSGLLQSVARDLELLAEGQPARRARFFSANYGDGKSHTLYAIWQLAKERNFLVSFVTVSRETPLNRSDKLYRKLAARTFVPGVGRPGLGPLLEAIEERPERVQRLLRFAAEHLNPKLRLALTVRFEGATNDFEAIDQDLSGYFAAAGDVKRAYKESVGKPPKIERFKLAHAFDYFRMVDQMAAAAGLSGWVILFDEVEMMARLGKRARAQAYELIGRLQDPQIMPHTCTVWALASSFQGDLLERLDERARLHDWLTQRGDEALSRVIEGPLRQLGGAPVLPPLSEEELSVAMAAIVAAHGEAYGWMAAISGEQLFSEIRRQIPERDAKVRQLVRAAVQYLDLVYQYGTPPTLSLEGLSEPEVAASDDDSDEGSGDVHRFGWPT